MNAAQRIQDGTWLCVQAGHRELYGIPRALHRVNALERLITDLWAAPGSLMARVAGTPWGRRVSDRYNSELPGAKIRDFSLRTLAWEAGSRVGRKPVGSAVLLRNRWWGELVAAKLEDYVTHRTRTVFSYCYEARPVFRAARLLDLKPVLGQIDPGPEEDRKVASLVRQWSRYRTSFQPGSELYYAHWREECLLARHVVVNSEWSRDALVKVGVEPDKIRIVPLVYTPPQESIGWRKEYPDTFTHARPLRVLFLGQCILRKGIAETIEAAQRLADRPVEFTLVGNTDIEGLETHFSGARINYHPRVSRAECHRFYREADVFLFPTHSDGFGLTQLEAQAWRLPVIASRFCAKVVEPGRTGWVLPEVTAGSIEQVLREILGNPAVLARYSSEIAPWRFGLEQLGRRLAALDLVEESAS